MKVTKHVEQLLRQGRSARELIELGFPKAVVTRVQRQLRAQKTGLRPKVPKGGTEAKSHPQPSAASSAEMALMQQKLASLESDLQKLGRRIEVLEATGAKGVSLEGIEARLNGTPALGLRHRFKCDCGASGLVALHIQCTKCGRESWWGWFPKQ